MRVEVDAQGITPYSRRLTDEEFQFCIGRFVCFCIDFAISDGKGGVLFVQRKIEPFKGFWTLPGGIVRRKEPIDDAIARLLGDELGLICIEKKLIGYIEHINDGDIRSSVSLVFAIKCEGRVRGSEQGQEFSFISDFSNPKIQPYQAEFFQSKLAP